MGSRTAESPVTGFKVSLRSSEALPMVTFSTRDAQDEFFERQLLRLSALVADMEAIRNSVPPECLADGAAPVLDRWRSAVTFAPCLVGLSTGHPLLPGQDRPIHTSDLWLIDKDHGWARTLSRWYRLGRPGDQADFHA